MKNNKLTILSSGMYSGKSTELIRRYQRNHYANRKALLFNHSLDNRYGSGVASTHDYIQVGAIPISSKEELNAYLEMHDEIKNVYVDEFQFFDDSFADFIIDLVENKSYSFTVAGLDLKSDNTPFSSIAKLYPYADEIHKLKSVCSKCGIDASKSFRLTDSKDDIEVGSNGKYIALCRDCYREENK